MRKIFKYPTILLSLLALSCERKAEPIMPDPSAPLLFSVDTKSLGPGERTFRAALFDLTSYAFRAQGSYCSETIDHTATVSGGEWLSPCRVDSNGDPLKTDGTAASGLAEADKDSKYGLRYGTNAGYHLTVASPAKAFSSDGQLRYYEWTSSTELYIGTGVAAGLDGAWLDGEYVYSATSNENLVLKDRRARLYIHIACGAQYEAYIQSVTLLNRVNQARWYLPTGFSASNYTTDDVVLYDWSVSGLNHLVKEPETSWTSTAEVFLPAIDFSDSSFDAMRPQIEVRMGNDTDHPSVALIDITQCIEPMMNYTYNINVSKSYVVVTLSAGAWDDGGTISSDDTETPAIIGTINLSGWDDNGTNNTDNWNTSFE